MTLARDPLVVIEAQRKVLKDVEWGDNREWCPSCRGNINEGHEPDCSLAAALALSAPLPAPEAKPLVALCGCVAGGNKCHYHNKHPQIPVSYAPAPERPSVEERPYKVDQQVDCYCVIGPTLHTYGPWPHDALGAAQAVGFADTLNAAYQAGRRAIGGGE